LLLQHFIFLYVFFLGKVSVIRPLAVSKIQNLQYQLLIFAYSSILPKENRQTIE